jgi:hypothetical protein
MIRKRPSFRRRALLGGLGGALLGLPLLEAFSGNRASAQVAPKRLVILTTPNGTNPATHWPTGSGADFELSPILSPLAAYRDQMVVLRGVDNLAAMATNVNGHTDAVRCMLTGRAAANQSNDDYTAGGGISVDQHIAADIGADSKFRSLEYVTDHIYAHAPNYCSFYGASQPAPFEDEPRKLFDRVFGDLTVAPDDPVAIARREDRLSVLDGAMANYAALERKLGSADRQRLAGHLDMVRDLEAQIENAVGAACDVPGQPAEGETDPAIGLDILVRALACDLTRVVTIRNFFWDDYPQLGATGSYHDDWLHNVTSDPGAADMVDRVKTFQAERIASILDRLRDVPEGEGTLLDSTLVVWVDEFCHAYAHRHDEVPWVLVSGADRFMPMGRYHHFTTPVSTNRVLNSLIAAMDAEGAGTFGDPEFDDEPLPELS